MGAEAIAALLKWPAIAGGAVLLLWLAYKVVQRGIAKSAVAQSTSVRQAEQLGEAARAQEIVAGQTPGRGEQATRLRGLAARSAERLKKLRKP